MFLPLFSAFFFLPLALSLSWDDEFSRVCWHPRKYMPFRDGNVFKQCSFSPRTGGKIEVVGCVNPVTKKRTPIGETTLVDSRTGAVEMLSEGEEKTEVCEYKDGQWEWRLGKRFTQELNEFLDQNTICKTNGFDLSFPVGNRYQQCRYDRKNGGRIEIVACKAIDGRAPLNVGEERRDNKRNDIERCTLHGDAVTYEYRPMTSSEIEKKDDLLRLCRENGFVNAFIHNGMYKRCASKGIVELDVVGCVSEAEKGALIPVNSRLESNGVVEICEEVWNGGKREIVFTSALTKREEEETTTESTTIEVTEEVTETTTSPVEESSKSNDETANECDKHEIDVVFFDGNVAKKCVRSTESSSEVVVETTGCRFALSNTVVPIGEKHERWGVVFRCVANQNEEVHLVVEEGKPVEPEVPMKKKKQCSFNGRIVPLNARLIVGDQFEFACKRRANRDNKVRRGAKTELRFLGCAETKRRGGRSLLRRKTSDVVCDLSSFDATNIKVIF